MSKILKSITLLIKKFSLYKQKSPSEKTMTQSQLIQNLGKIFTFRRLLIYGMITNGIGIVYYVNKYNQHNYNISYSRIISRITGRITNITIPTFLRKSVYRFYMKLYNVNEDEILDKDLTKYRSLKDFFIREIKVKYIIHYFN